jgi:hypothetical protein
MTPEAGVPGTGDAARERPSTIMCHETHPCRREEKAGRELLIGCGGQRKSPNPVLDGDKGQNHASQQSPT